MPRKKRSPTTCYYCFERSPARAHKDELGDLTGDVYRSGQGIVAVAPPMCITTVSPSAAPGTTSLCAKRRA